MPSAASTTVPSLGLAQPSPPEISLLPQIYAQAHPSPSLLSPSLPDLRLLTGPSGLPQCQPQTAWWGVGCLWGQRLHSERPRTSEPHPTLVSLGAEVEGL
ncbi:Hypothetical predicted protein [Podarcis lilfordi]|uniref:Uncharacterized protein n=1 Tax=Podarcis lilfordi TaxID=74358 RepID=A0AA35KYP9_9SAUR|nr:Hypothetical predicted protein [Podarcis lilfordi]